MTPMPLRLYLIRHGEAYSNVENVIGGMNGDLGLTERGFRQAQALAERLRGGEIKPDVLYASTLPRARQTAEYVAEALDMPITWVKLRLARGIEVMVPPVTVVPSVDEAV